MRETDEHYQIIVPHFDQMKLCLVTLPHLLESTGWKVSSDLNFLKSILRFDVEWILPFYRYADWSMIEKKIVFPVRESFQEDKSILYFRLFIE